MDREKTIKISLILFVGILIISFFGVLQWSLAQSSYFFNQGTAALEHSVQPVVLKKDAIVVSGGDKEPILVSPTVESDAFLAINVANGNEKVLLHKSENKKLPVASLTKLMTALIVLERYNVEQKITITESAMAELGEQGNLKLGEILSVKNLLYITLMESSNRAAKALSEVMGTDGFIILMNKKARAMGLLNTHFQDATGLSLDSYSSAQDIAILSSHLFKNYPLFREIVSLKEYNLYLDNGFFHHKLVSTNRFLGEVGGVVGGKTGWTNISRGCFMVIQKKSNGSYFVYVILGAEDRFLEMEKLISLTNPT